MNDLLKSLILLIGVTMAINANAQLSIGVRGGYNHANVHLTEGLDNLTPDVKAIDAYSVAAVVEMPLGHGFSFQPELAYTQKGFRMAEGFEFELFNFPIPVDVEAESRFNYLEAPLLFKYELGDGKVRAYVTGGPSFGYATSGRLRTFTNLLVEIKLLDTNIDLESIDYQRFEVAAVAGAGLKVDAGRIQIFADARYQHGFTELYDIPVLDERIRNKGFGVNAGVLVPLKPW